MLTVDACGKDMLSFAEYLTGYSAMESGGFLASEFCIFGVEKEDDEVGDEDQEGEDLENAKKPRASFG